MEICLSYSLPTICKCVFFIYIIIIIIISWPAMCLTRHHVQYLKMKIIYLRKNYKLIQTRFSYE